MNELYVWAIGGFASGACFTGILLILGKIIKGLRSRKKNGKKSKDPEVKSLFDFTNEEPERKDIIPLDPKTQYVPPKEEQKVQIPVNVKEPKIIPKEETEIIALIDGKAVKLKLNDTKLFGKRTFIEK